MYSFLAALPAILGLVAFVVYHFLNKHTRGDEITKRILDKIRLEMPDLVAKYEGLPIAERKRFIAKDQVLRRHISEVDSRLLQQALRQQFIMSLVIYSIASALVVVGVALFVYTTTRPQRTSISDVRITAIHRQSKGLLVDLDPVRVTWKSAGEGSDVDVYLENIDTGKRSVERKVGSYQEWAVFHPDDYWNVLHTRERATANRIRAVVRSKTDSVESTEYALSVGIKITVVGFEDKIKVIARIGNRTIDFYNFEATVVIPRKSGVAEFLTLDGFEYNDNDRPIRDPEDLDWNE